MLGSRISVLAVAGGVLLLTGLVTGAGSADTPKAGSADIGYSCAFPGSTAAATVHVQATFPATVATGGSARAEDLAMTVTLPVADLTDLTKAGAASVSGQVQLTAVVGQHATSTPVAWPALAVAATPVPATGSLVLTATGTGSTQTDGSGAAIPVAGNGDVTVTAGSLGLALVPRTADGGPTTPSALAGSCHPAAGQNTVLATIPMPAGTGAPGTGAPGTTTPPATGSAPPGGRGTPVAVGPSPAWTKAAQARGPHDDTVPDWCKSYQGPPGDTPECAYIVGFSDVHKLKDAALLGGTDPGRASLASDAAQIYFDDGGVLHITDHTSGTLTMPPSPATFLAFGFMPTTATMHLTQVGLLTADSNITDLDPYPETTIVKAQMNLRLSDVSENGVPLNVGDDCHTTTPLGLSLTGIAPSSVDVEPGAYTLQSGGPLTGDMVIPTFTGCGVGENLDPLLDSLISGPDNYVEMTQGSLCFPGDGTDENPPSNCPPTVPTPQH